MPLNLLTTNLVQAVFGVNHAADDSEKYHMDSILQPQEIFRAMTDPEIGFPPLPLLPSLALES